MLETSVLLAHLAHCTGTETYYRHWTQRLVYTDGIKTLADGADAHWLIDAIASHQPFLQQQHPQTCNYQTWTLTVYPARMASLTCTLNDAPQALRQEILFTDFPLPDIKLYCFDGVLLLPSEN
jgi:hypothetical protein